MSGSRSPAASGSGSRKVSTEGKTASTKNSYAFLNFSHPAEAKEQSARRTVRSHVTRQQHQKEQLAAAAVRRSNSMPQPQVASAEFTEGAGENAASLSQAPSDPRVLPDRLTSASVPSSPWAIASSSPLTTRIPIDLRHIYPPRWIPYCSSILDHYVVSMSHDILNAQDRSVTDAFRTLWLPFVFTDAALLHATLLVGSSILGSSPTLQTHEIDILQLRGMAISAINESLRDPTQSPSDQTIAAVLCVAQYEAFWGETQLFALHMRAVRDMVDVRGGLAGVSTTMHGLLEKMVLAVDHHASQRTGSRTSLDPAWSSTPIPQGSSSIQ